MKENYYTYLGCSCVVEHLIANIEGEPPEDVAKVAKYLEKIRLYLLEHSSNDSSGEAFREVFKEQALLIMKSIELLQKSNLFEDLHDKLTDLLEEYYNLAKSVMDGGGVCGYAGCTIDSSIFHSHF